MLPSGMFMLPSKFGYIITGKCPDIRESIIDGKSCTLFVSTEVSQIVSELCLQCPATTPVIGNPRLEDLWCLENIGISDLPFVNNDDEALKHFNETIKFNDGRYQITLPWKGNEFSLSDNYSVAIARMKILIHCLQADKDLLQKYDEIIQQQIRNNIIKEVDVTKPNKETTKIRIVYDASAKAKSTASSLNECLLRGPIILPDLCGLLLRFRLYELVLLADVEKAFLQIGIQERERDVTHFLWLRDIHSATMSESNLVVYRFCRVPFGLICSPFLLGATLKFHLQDEGTPLALNILNNMYVDNVLMGTDSVEEAYCIYQKAKIIFKKASMNLRQWNSNSEEFLKSLPPGERSLGNTNVMKVLGIM